MSGATPQSRRAARLASALLAGAALLPLSVPAYTQENGLRGSASEARLTRGLLEGEQTALEQPVATENVVVEGAPRRQRYQPVSEGALPDEMNLPASQRSMAGATDGTDPTGEALEPAPVYRPTTARQRQPSAARRSATANETGAEAAEPRRTTAVIDPEAVPDPDLPTGTVRTPRVDSEVDLRIDPGAERAEPIEGLQPSDVDENPYEAPGIRIGTFLFRPTLETGIGWTSNADSSPNGKASTYSETTLRFIATSDWPRHRASLEGYGTFRKSISGAEIRDFSAGLSGDAEVEISESFRVLAALDYSRAPESASSPVTIVGTVSRPIRHVIGGSLGLEKDVGKLRFGVTGALNREIFGNADLSTGGTLSQADRNSTLATVALRGGYEISPALVPFVELEAGRRFYELDRDSSGYNRSANRIAARAGVELDLGEKVGGEISAGWVQERPDDRRLASISGATVDADLRWSPLRGTTVGLTGQTFVEGTTTPGETGSILYTGRLNVERQMRANLTGNVAVGASLRNYAGSNGRDTILFGEAGLTWWMNRYLGITGRARHEALTSNLPGRDSKTTSVFLGIRLQR